MKSPQVTYNVKNENFEAKCEDGFLDTYFVFPPTLKEGDQLPSLMIYFREESEAFQFIGQYNPISENLEFLFDGPVGYSYKMSISLDPGSENPYVWKAKKHGCTTAFNAYEDAIVYVPKYICLDQSSLVGAREDVMEKPTFYGTCVPEVFCTLRLKIGVVPGSHYYVEDAMMEEEGEAKEGPKEDYEYVHLDYRKGDNVTEGVEEAKFGDQTREMDEKGDGGEEKTLVIDRTYEVTVTLDSAGRPERKAKRSERVQVFNTLPPTGERTLLNENEGDKEKSASQVGQEETMDKTLEAEKSAAKVDEREGVQEDEEVAEVDHEQVVEDTKTRSALPGETEMISEKEDDLVADDDKPEKTGVSSGKGSDLPTITRGGADEKKPSHVSKFSATKTRSGREPSVHAIKDESLRTKSSKGAISKISKTIRLSAKSSFKSLKGSKRDTVTVIATKPKVPESREGLSQSQKESGISKSKASISHKEDVSGQSHMEIQKEQIHFQLDELRRAGYQTFQKSVQPDSAPSIIVEVPASSPLTTVSSKSKKEPSSLHVGTTGTKSKPASPTTVPSSRSRTPAPSKSKSKSKTPIEAKRTASEENIHIQLDSLVRGSEAQERSSRESRALSKDIEKKSFSEKSQREEAATQEDSLLVRGTGPLQKSSGRKSKKLSKEIRKDLDEKAQREETGTHSDSLAPGSETELSEKIRELSKRVAKCVLDKEMLGKESAIDKSKSSTKKTKEPSQEADETGAHSDSLAPGSESGLSEKKSSEKMRELSKRVAKCVLDEEKLRKESAINTKSKSSTKKTKEPSQEPSKGKASSHELIKCVLDEEPERKESAIDTKSKSSTKKTKEPSQEPTKGKASSHELIKCVLDEESDVERDTEGKPESEVSGTAKSAPNEISGTKTITLSIDELKSTLSREEIKSLAERLLSESGQGKRSLSRSKSFGTRSGEQGRETDFLEKSLPKTTKSNIIFSKSSVNGLREDEKMATLEKYDALPKTATRSNVSGKQVCERVHLQADEIRIVTSDEEEPNSKQSEKSEEMGEKGQNETAKSSMDKLITGPHSETEEELSSNASHGSELSKSSNLSRTLKKPSTERE